MEYTRLDFNDINLLPKSKIELENNVKLKIKKLEESNDIVQRSIALNLKKALKWLKESKNELPKLNDNNYYRLGYHISENKSIVFNIQIWKKFLEDVDTLDTIYMSSSNDDMDNDEETIIFPYLSN